MLVKCYILINNRKELGNILKKTITAAIMMLILASIAYSSEFEERTSGKQLVLNESLLTALVLCYPQLMLAMGYQFDDLDFQDANIFSRDTSTKQPFIFLRPPAINRRDLTNYNSNIYQVEKRATLDSTISQIRYEEYFDSVKINYSYPIDLEEYLIFRKERLQRNLWDSLTTSYDMKKALSGGDLASMLSQATGLTIPIPPNPISSIFGKPEIGLNVNGEVNLRIGWRWDSQNLGTVSAFGQTQSSPIFHQDIRVNVSGRIGDKLMLGTNWNTRRTFDYENHFKVGFEGYDDDIIKKLEFGNVDFPIPSTLIGGGSALFGVRADFQFGPLFLKTVFSQRKGQRKYIDVRGGASKQYFSLRAYDYAKNHFFLDTAYKAVYDEYFKYSTPIIPRNASRLRIVRLEVWEAITEISNPHVANAVAIADLPGKRLAMGEDWSPAEKSRPIQSGVVERGRFILLDSTKYRYDRNLGTLTIYNLRQDRYYAVAYSIEGDDPDNTRDDIYFGKFSDIVGERDTLILKLIYRPNLVPAYKDLWDRQMKNIYSINASNVNINETTIGIWYTRQTNDSTDIIEGATDKLVTIFGVDQVNNSTGAAPPDGLFDLRPPFFDPIRGEITFPHTAPFAGGLRRYFDQQGNPEIAELYTFDQVYDTTYDAARRNTARDRFVISGEVSGRQSNRIALGAFNLAPNSVRVTLDGVPLREHDDYIVDYYAGILTIRNPRASLPNANLKIEYEQHDIFTIATKTLAGIRADMSLWKSRNANAGVGATFMYYDQSAIIDRVRLGDEPVSNMMFGLDASGNWNAPWLTKALDMLPFYDTKAPSSFNLKGEWAMILPEPNKRRSEVASDNNSPVVYIDDFEGAQRYIPMGLIASQWQHSSSPNDPFIDSSAAIRQNFRAKMFWYQYFIPKVPLREVYPENRSFQQGRQNISTLYISFYPSHRGIYNMNPDYLDPINPQYDPAYDFSSNPANKPKIWGGMMRLLSSFNTNFDNENIEYIEVMMRINAYEPGATKMYIDMGQISEDIIPNGVPDTEDGITEQNPFPNGIIDQGEDIGIDAWDDTREQLEYPFPLNLEDDPARDNYKFNFNKRDEERTEFDFEFYNNFEGNARVSELGQFPDKEALNPNNGLEINLDDSYFTYEVNLFPDPVNNPQIVGGNPEMNWFLYRIPIRKPSGSVGNPQYSNIQYIRVRFQGGIFKGEIADWRLVGSQWQRTNDFQANVSPLDSVLSIAFVNLWENSGEPDYYTMPPGVSAPRQLNNPDPTQDIRLNEQSLAISVKNLRWGEERMAVRIFRPLDIFYYKQMKFFIHGDGSMPANFVQGARAKAYAFIRFGIDSANYYEYRRPLIRGWQDLGIDLAELTAIKQIRDTSFQYDRQVFPVPGDPYAHFAIKGNPILTRIQFFGLGIANPSDAFQELSATMWVNELRLIDPEASADWAGVGSFNIQLADLGTINASFNTYKPNFHLIEERFGNRMNSTNWNVTMTGNLEKFAPQSFAQMRIPITYTHAEFMDNPVFQANSDVNLNEASRAAYQRARDAGLSEEEANRAADEVRHTSQSLRVLDSWALTGIKLGIPVTHWLVNETFNRVTVGYSYSQEFERSSLYKQKFNWMWKLNVQYALPIPDVLNIKPLTWIGDIPFFGAYKDWKISFLPANFTTSLDMTRRRATEQSRFLQFPSPVIRDFSANRMAGFNWKLTEGGFINPIWDYNFTTNSTLVPLEFDAFGRQRTGNEIAREMFFKDGLIDLGKDNLHTQTFSINFKPILPKIANISSFIDMSGSFMTTYNWTDPLQPDPTIRDIAKSAGFNNTIRLNNAIRLKAMSDGWFGIVPPSPTRRRLPTDTAAQNTQNVASVSRIFKTIFLDWEKLDINFNQTNSSQNPGVFGGTGLSNVWGRSFTGRESIEKFGPSTPYQLGLVSSPHGNFEFTGSDKFPYFGFKTTAGRRPANAVVQENFSQNTTLDLKTARPLWEGATLDLNWKTNLSFNRNQTIETDEFGNPTPRNAMITETFNRTFITFPTMFGFNPFNNTIDRVVELYNERKEVIVASTDLDTMQKNQALMRALNESFYEALEAFSFTGGRAAKFLPSLNWGIRWDGLEKYKFWRDYVKKVTVDHVYTSTYQENVQVTNQGRAVQNQIVQYGFNPVIGVTANFDDEVFDGTLTANVRWSSTTSYQLNAASRSTISKQNTNEITMQASYTMRGFEFPLFGINLKNDLEYSFLFTFKDNNQGTFDVLDRSSFTGRNKDGRTLTGNKQIIVEPRARYSMSNRVTASFFVRYEGTFNEGAAQPGFHTTQVGLDIRISLAGGR